MHSVIVSREEELRMYFSMRDVSKLSVGEDVVTVLRSESNHHEDQKFFVFDDYLFKRLSVHLSYFNIDFF